MFKCFNEMVENLSKKEFQVCDARSPAMYSGQGTSKRIAKYQALYC